MQDLSSGMGPGSDVLLMRFADVPEVKLTNELSLV
jgi:hypothetical protein